MLLSALHPLCFQRPQAVIVAIEWQCWPRHGSEQGLHMKRFGIVATQLHLGCDCMMCSRNTGSLSAPGSHAPMLAVHRIP